MSGGLKVIAESRIFRTSHFVNFECDQSGKLGFLSKYNWQFTKTLNQITMHPQLHLEIKSFTISTRLEEQEMFFNYEMSFIVFEIVRLSTTESN